MEYESSCLQVNSSTIRAQLKWCLQKKKFPKGNHEMRQVYKPWSVGQIQCSGMILLCDGGEAFRATSQSPFIVPDPHTVSCWAAASTACCPRRLYALVFKGEWLPAGGFVKIRCDIQKNIYINSFLSSEDATSEYLRMHTEGLILKPVVWCYHRLWCHKCARLRHSRGSWHWCTVQTPQHPGVAMSPPIAVSATMGWWSRFWGWGRMTGRLREEDQPRECDGIGGGTHHLYLNRHVGCPSLTWGCFSLYQQNSLLRLLWLLQEVAVAILLPLLLWNLSRTGLKIIHEQQWQMSSAVLFVQA